MNSELLLFAKAIWYGAVLLGGYDIFRILRRVIRHFGWIVMVEDLFYWVSSGLFLFSKIYIENSGILRGYFFIGVVLGAIFYHYSISKLFVRYVSKLLIQVKKIIKKVLKVVLSVIKRLKFGALRCKISLSKHFCKFSRKKSERDKGIYENEENVGENEGEAQSKIQSADDGGD